MQKICVISSMSDIETGAISNVSLKIGFGMVRDPTVLR